MGFDRKHPTAKQAYILSLDCGGLNNINALAKSIGQAELEHVIISGNACIVGFTARFRCALDEGVHAALEAIAKVGCEIVGDAEPHTRTQLAGKAKTRFATNRATRKCGIVQTRGCETNATSNIWRKHAELEILTDIGQQKHLLDMA